MENKSILCDQLEIHHIYFKLIYFVSTNKDQEVLMESREEWTRESFGVLGERATSENF